jgi:hypothetical protein
MAKTPKNHGQPWSHDDIKKLRNEAKSNTPTPVLGLHLNRTPGAIRAKAQAIGLSLKPTNKSPYGTKKK